LKTNSSGKLARSGALLLGAFLLLSLPAVFTVRAGTFKYANQGEAAWVTATNSDDNSTFVINGTQIVNVLTTLSNGSGIFATNESSYGITSGHFVFLNGSLYGNNTEAYTLKNGLINMTIPMLTQNMSLSRGYGNVTISSLLASMHSSYALIGTGNLDKFYLSGGITSDTFSVTGPGFGDNVFINGGTGNDTYNINLGINGNVTITGSNATSIGSTTNVYNIIF
jgi:hypothetical protein